jgi:hypothetical protein
MSTTETPTTDAPSDESIRLYHSELRDVATTAAYFGIDEQAVRDSVARAIFSAPNRRCI